jgi:dephospho-CoA kinase
MLKIGITGGIGSGKTYICNVLETMGYPVFYADVEAKKLMCHDAKLISEIKQLLGPDAYIGNELNKTYISQAIFHDEKIREQLNKIVHPTVFRAFNEWADKKDYSLVFNESAILFETDSHNRFDKTILITSTLETRIRRIQKRDKLGEKDIKLRMKSQLDDVDKMKLADFIIINEDDTLVLPQLIAVLEQIL